MVNTRWYTQARVDEIIREKDAEIARLRSLWPTNGLGMETNVHQLVKNHRAWTERAIERADAAEAEVKKLRHHLAQTMHTLRLRTKAMHRVLKRRDNW